jgi:hypothetical protein
MSSADAGASSNTVFAPPDASLSVLVPVTLKLHFPQRPQFTLPV